MDKLVLVVVLASFCVFAVNAAEDDQCGVSGADRVECGWLGITKDQCLKRGCCWNSSDPNAKFCFVKMGQQLPVGQCPVAPSERKDCGFYGITKDQCLENHCCWDDSVENTPWCFDDPEACDVSGADRVECGWPGITEDQCSKRGCCFVSSDSNAKFCFVKKGQQLPVGQCPVAPSERQDCGFYGITKDQCLEKKCCWDDSVQNTPWCFKEPSRWSLWSSWKDCSCGYANRTRTCLAGSCDGPSFETKQCKMGIEYPNITTTEGKQCWFPFTYNGQCFDGCTMYYSGSLWCSYQYGHDESNWGYCP